MALRSAADPATNLCDGLVRANCCTRRESPSSVKVGATQVIAAALALELASALQKLRRAVRANRAGVGGRLVWLVERDCGRRRFLHGDVRIPRFAGGASPSRAATRPAPLKGRRRVNRR